MEVIGQYGEDTYSINENGLITGTLSEDKMKLIKDYNGQFMVYILRVVKELLCLRLKKLLIKLYGVRRRL